MARRRCNDIESAHADKKKSAAEKQKVIDRSQYPLFSIIVLCYKNADLLYGMLNTIFMQDYPRMQLIVSDDGSGDFDVAKVQAYIDERKTDDFEQILVLKNAENSGTVKHIHKVLQQATGEYVIFTAADDRFNTDDVVSNYVAAFQKNPEAKWLVARCCITTADYQKTIYITPTDEDAPYFRVGNAQRLFSRWSRRGMAIPCCMAFKREAFDLVGGIDLDYQYLEDWPLVLKLLRNGYAPIYFEKTTACHSAGGVTNSNDRYGVKIRKAFYDDKYLLFRKEVEPYQELILPEDQESRKKYIKTIMDRSYFLDIEYQAASIAAKLKATLKNPKHFFWALEFEYMKRRDKVQRKKMVAISQALFLLCFLFLQFEGSFVLEVIFRTMGILDLAAGLLLFICGLVTYPMELFFRFKARERRKLVN